MMTENLFHRVWTLVSHRRLKNIAVILDWVPHTSKLGIVTHAELDGSYLYTLAVELQLVDCDLNDILLDTRRYAPIEDGTNGTEGISPLQCLKRAFEMLNVSGTGRINKADFKSLLQTLDVLPTDDNSAAEREVCLVMCVLMYYIFGWMLWRQLLSYPLIFHNCRSLYYWLN